jgi:hypothetical protein
MAGFTIALAKPPQRNIILSWFRKNAASVAAPIFPVQPVADCLCRGHLLGNIVIMGEP